MGLTVVFARLKETIPERQMTAPSSARLADEMKRAGKLKSKAGVAHEAHHMSAATITPSASGGSFNPRPDFMRRQVRSASQSALYSGSRSNHAPHKSRTPVPPDAAKRLPRTRSHFSFVRGVAQKRCACDELSRCRAPPVIPNRQRGSDFIVLDQTIVLPLSRPLRFVC